MTSPASIQANNSSSAAEPPAEPLVVDSDFVVILAALLCALICVVGLIAVARCAWLRRTAAQVQANKGLKKKIIRSLPRLTFDGGASGGEKLTDCAICLTEFAVGDEIRVLPQCGHGFHVGCVDTWLGTHSSCPSCRRILVSRCQNCGCRGYLPGSSSAGVGDIENGLKPGEDDRHHHHHHHHHQQQQQQQQQHS